MSLSKDYRRTWNLCVHFKCGYIKTLVCKRTDEPQKHENIKRWEGTVYTYRSGSSKTISSPTSYGCKYVVF